MSLSQSVYFYLSIRPYLHYSIHLVYYFLAKSVYIVHIPLSPFLNLPSRILSPPYNSSRFLIGYISNVFSKTFLFVLLLNLFYLFVLLFSVHPFIFLHPTIKMIKRNTLMYKAILFLYTPSFHISVLIFINICIVHRTYLK